MKKFIILAASLLLVQFVQAQDPAYPPALAAAGNIIKSEYFIDTDPGFGSGIDIPISAATDIAGVIGLVNTSLLSIGTHRIYIRTLNIEGSWSMVNISSFTVDFDPAYTSSPAVGGNIIKAEYFIDTDPGFGGGINIPLTAALDIAGLIASVNTAALNTATHRIFIRTLNVEGDWSLTNSSSFVVDDNPVYVSAPAAPGNIIKTEYFIDTDPGFGNGIDFPVSASVDIVDALATVNLSSISDGTHRIYIRTLNEERKWSMTENQAFTILCIAENAGLIRGQDENLCGGGTDIKYTISPIAGASVYNWKVPANCSIVSGQGTISIRVNFPSNYDTGYIVVAAANSCSSTLADSLKVTARPRKPEKIIGGEKVNANETGILFKVANIPGYIYTWTVPAGALITAGQGTSSIIVSWGTITGNVTVFLTNSCGISRKKEKHIKVNTTSTFATSAGKIKIGDNESKLQVYPNPAKNECTVLFGDTDEGKYTIEITDINGRKVFIKNSTTHPGENKIKIDVSKLGKGNYLISIIDETYGRRVLKLLKD